MQSGSRLMLILLENQRHAGLMAIVVIGCRDGLAADEVAIEGSTLLVTARGGEARARLQPEFVTAAQPIFSRPFGPAGVGPCGAHPAARPAVRCAAETCSTRVFAERFRSPPRKAAPPAPPSSAGVDSLTGRWRKQDFSL
jgi:hypothetical protein